MKNFKGTKGNWELVGANDIKVDGVLVACALGSYVGGEYEHTNECKANAKLIACAPEMLEMLIGLNRYCTMKVEDRNKLELLIKKATE